MDDSHGCGPQMGCLPECAPLAVSYVPMQQRATHTYDFDDALKRGTLFPGLDLPFMNIVNTKNVADTPLGELQALHFVCHELRLYLDTHEDDKEAFETLKSLIRLTQEAHKRYVEKYGPISVGDLENAKSYTWVNNPWPWEYRG